jgi:site-specific DNA-cytosine methylase
MTKNVVSVFDGMSCLQISLRNLGIEIDNYYASEIDPDAIKVTLSNFPKTKYLGDVRYIDTSTLFDIWLLSAGSPCTDFSLMGLRKGLLDIHTLDEYIRLKNEGFDFGNTQSILFFEFLRILKELNPTYFFLENVVLKGEFKKYEKLISEYLGVEPIIINSSLVSSQNRERCYWTNIPNVTVPKDKKIYTFDVIPNSISCGNRGVMNKDEGKYIQKLTFRKDDKFNCLVTKPNSTNLVKVGNEDIRKITIEESERIQTVPVGYTNVEGVSDSSRYKMIGNGWTINVIDHLLEPLINE